MLYHKSGIIKRITIVFHLRKERFPMIYYVNAKASRDGNGTKEMPFRHIDDAARVARPGDEVLVAPGIYREYVNPIHAGEENNRIV